MPVIVDEEEFRFVLAEAELGGILPVPIKDFHDIPVLIMDDLPVFLLVHIPQEAVIPFDGEGSPGIREDAPLLPVHFEDGILLLMLPPDEEVPRGAMWTLPVFFSRMVNEAGRNSYQDRFT